MRIEIAHNVKLSVTLVVKPEGRRETVVPRARTIRLDRHIRQAEWAERLQSR